MNAKKLTLALAGIAALSGGSAHAELQPFEVGGATFKIGGNFDEYLNFMRSSSGSKITALQDGGFLRSRVNFFGEKPVDEGVSVKFGLEQGLNFQSGAQADTTRLFDRQAWVGVKSNYGEFRAGRQNSVLLVRGSYIDFGARDLGGIVNAFGVPSRYDSDVSYISPKISGFVFETHYSTAGAAVNSSTNQGVVQVALDYDNGPYRIGYAGLAGKQSVASSAQKMVEYNNVWVNYDYGMGKIYATFVRSNNNTSTCTSTTTPCPAGFTLNNGGTPLGNTGNLGNYDLGVNTYYNIYQLSADYKLTPKLRIGGLFGRIADTSGTGKNADGWNLGAFYDVWKDTQLYAMLDSIKNDQNASFRPAGSAGLTKNFLAASDVTGKTISGLQLGFIYKF